MDGEIDDLLHKALEYLRDELTTYTSSRGNHQDVIRIAKALRELAAGKPDPAVSAAEEARQRFFNHFLGAKTGE